MMIMSNDALMFILQVGGGGTTARLVNDVDGYDKALAKFKASWARYYTPACQTIADLEAAASKLMAEVAGA